MGKAGKGKITDAEVAELLIPVYMAEYTALREEILQHMRRVSNLVIYSIAGTGALVGSTAITNFADRQDIFASVLFLVSILLFLVSATCIGTEANILLINGYLADRADEIRETLQAAAGELGQAGQAVQASEPVQAVQAARAGQAGERKRIREKMFSWENESISRPAHLFSRDTATSWGGSVLEILVVIVLAIAALTAAGSVFLEHETARTLLTTILFVLDGLIGFAILVWAIRWAYRQWNPKKVPEGKATTRMAVGQPKGGKAS